MMDTHPFLLSRRQLLMRGGALISAAALVGLWPRLTLAALPIDRRFVLVILRGALDGLAAVPPYGDPAYSLARRGLAFAPPGDIDGMIDLNGFFGLHPALASLLPLYQQQQLAIFHAIASPYRERSHFDAQNLLENGTIRPGGTEGWLNRALQAVSAQEGAAMALSQQLPLVLQGGYRAGSWAPKAYAANSDNPMLAKMMQLYARDPLLGESFSTGLAIQKTAEENLTPEDLRAAGNARGTEALMSAAKAAAGFLAEPDGARIAVLEAGGWDTHARQGTVQGQLTQRLTDLGKALASFPNNLDATIWAKTVVVVVTEFGRTVAENGTGGTDHGTGGVAFMLGGAVRGGNIYSQWPGLTEGKLYQGRDLYPTMDIRSLFKTVLAAHLKLPMDIIENNIFPNSAEAPIYGGLIG